MSDLTILGLAAILALLVCRICDCIEYTNTLKKMKEGNENDNENTKENYKKDKNA